VNSDRNRALNRLIAAALNHADAVRLGRGPSGQAGFLAAVDAYRDARDPFDAARDDFLAQYPTPEAMAAAVDRLRAAPGGFVDAALRAEGEASARLDGDTVDVGPVTVTGTLPDGDPCPCHTSVYPGCPLHDRPGPNPLRLGVAANDVADWLSRHGHPAAWVTPENTVACVRHPGGCPPPDAWVSPGGTLCCHRHIDGCPPGIDYDRAWHRMQVRGLNGPDDPQGACGRHTGNASNRCLLRVGHPGVCDDLSAPPR